MKTTIAPAVAAVVVLFASLAVSGMSNTASAGNAGYYSGYGGGPKYRTVYETRYKTVETVKYKEVPYTIYVSEKIEVPREVVETRYRTIEDVVYQTVTDYKLVKIDRGYYDRQAYTDSYGCTQYRKVWVPQYITKKVPYERTIKQYITKKVPYEVTHTVYETVVKQVPVEKIKRVPYVVYEKVPYRVAKKVAYYGGSYGGGGYGY